jgi:hypothetical protein
MDEDPLNEAFVLSLLEVYGVDEAEAMDTEPVPRAEDWREKYTACMDRGELPLDRSVRNQVEKYLGSCVMSD